MRSKSVHGFEIGDQAKAQVPKGNKQETYPGRVALRETGSRNLKTSTATVEGINHKHCRLIQRGDRLRLVTASPISNTSSESNALAPRPERRGLKRMNQMNVNPDSSSTVLVISEGEMRITLRMFNVAANDGLRPPLSTLLMYVRS